MSRRIRSGNLCDLPGVYWGRHLGTIKSTTFAGKASSRQPNHAVVDPVGGIDNPGPWDGLQGQTHGKGRFASRKRARDFKKIARCNRDEATDKNLHASCQLPTVIPSVAKAAIDLTREFKEGVEAFNY